MTRKPKENYLLQLDFLLVVPIGKSHYVVPPVGLGYLATALRKSGFDNVAILDSIKETLDFRKFTERIKILAPQIVGFQVFSSDFSSVKTCSRIVKEVLPVAWLLLVDLMFQLEA